MTIMVFCVTLNVVASGWLQHAVAFVLSRSLATSPDFEASGENLLRLAPLTQAPLPISGQVASFLLDGGYLLTALELLVEAQQRSDDELADLLAPFFADRSRFPPDELLKHQSGDGMCRPPDRVRL